MPIAQTCVLAVYQLLTTGEPGQQGRQGARHPGSGAFRPRPHNMAVRPLRSRRLSQTRKFVELRVDIHEWISVIMWADQKDSGNIGFGKCNDHPERSGEMRYTDLGEKVVT